jgi:tripartite-type tricarboxylate transporter receptor subunit TctC
MNRRDTVTALLALGTAAVSLGVHAQGRAYPAKSVRWIVPYAPGGFVDTRSRQLAARLAELWKQPVVVDNRPGAGGVIGTEIVVRAAGDGYTIGMGSFPPLAANVSLMKSLPYDPLRDLANVVLVEKSPLVLMVHPSVAAKTVAEFVALARAARASSRSAPRESVACTISRARCSACSRASTSRTYRTRAARRPGRTFLRATSR